MTGEQAADHADDHTDPELRARLEEEIEAGERRTTVLAAIERRRSAG